MRFPIITALLFGLFAPTGVAAQEEQEEQMDAQAQIHFQSGRAHFDSGNYEQALSEFQSAHRLSGRPALLYNIYLSHQNLGQLAEAEDALAKYLDEAEVPDDQRQQLTARLENLRRRRAEGGGAAAEPVAATAAVAGGDPTAPTPEAGHEHTGFFLRGMIGFGYATASRGSPIGDITLRGGTTPGALAIGWAFFDDLAFQVELFGATVVGATIELPSGITVRDNSTEYSAGGLGVGATYWFMPLNLYLSLTIGGGSASATLDGRTSETDVGLAAAFAVGKEWWIGEEWGLGVAGVAYFFSANNASSDASVGEATLTANVFAVMGSVTFN